MKCEYCEKEIDGSYGSGRFCNKKCQLAKAYIDNKNFISQKTKEKNTYKRITVQKICEKCGYNFDVVRKIHPETGEQIIHKKEIKFCSSHCSHSRIQTEETRKKLSQSLLKTSSKKQTKISKARQDKLKTDIEKVCPTCNNNFLTTRPNKIYCSKKCADKRVREKIYIIESPLFNVIRIGKRSKNYMYYKVEGHPNADKRGRILMHRGVLELHLGRYLTKEEIVHHKDGNGLNNDISNLEILSHKEHNRLHGLKRKDTVILICPECGIGFERSKRNTHLASYNKRERTFCSRSCSTSFYKNSR